MRLMASQVPEQYGPVTGSMAICQQNLMVPFAVLLFLHALPDGPAFAFLPLATCLVTCFTACLLVWLLAPAAFTFVATPENARENRTSTLVIRPIDLVRNDIELLQR